MKLDCFINIDSFRIMLQGNNSQKTAIHNIATEIFSQDRLLSSNYKPKILKGLKESVSANGSILLEIDCNGKDGLRKVLNIFIIDFKVPSKGIDSCKLTKSSPLSFEIKQEEKLHHDLNNQQKEIMVESTTTLNSQNPFTCETSVNSPKILSSNLTNRHTDPSEQSPTFTPHHQMTQLPKKEEAGKTTAKQILSIPEFAEFFRNTDPRQIDLFFETIREDRKEFSKSSGPSEIPT